MSEFEDLGEIVAEFTVVIPARNEEENILTCLESVMIAATKVTPSPKIIVVDDHSSDSTAALAESCGGQIVRLEGRKGLLSAWAAGVDASTTPFIIFVDADCTIGEDSIALLLRALSRPGVGVASGRPVSSDDNQGRNRVSRRSIVNRSANFSSLLLEELKGHLGDHDFIAIGRLLAVRRDAWKIENTVLPHNDREVASRARQSGWKVVWVPEAHVKYDYPSTFLELQSDWERTSRSRHPDSPQQFDTIPPIAVILAGLSAMWRAPLDGLSWSFCRIALIARGIRRGRPKNQPPPVSWD
jgi:cellulose synthase/poly-beta-1,6-N-acetylglucosamine synthase-like glycosyltransferase